MDLGGIPRGSLAGGVRDVVSPSSPRACSRGRIAGNVRSGKERSLVLLDETSLDS